MPRQTVTHLAVEELLEHPGNVRNDLGDLGDLARSIREHGILQPLTVTEHPGGGYLLIAGHRRLAAARRASLARVPVIIRHNVTDQADQLVLMLVENCQRRDLNPIEKAEAYGALRNQGLTHADIARCVGVSPATVSHYLALLELDDDERDELRGGHINYNDAFSVIRARRQAARQPQTGRIGRPKGATTKPYFGDAHPLAMTVRAACSHRGRPKVGGVGCGPCWEDSIRADADGATPPPVVHDVDTVVVQRVLDGDYRQPCNPAERREVLRRWTASGRSAADLGRLTGWRPGRYFHQSELIEDVS